MLSVRRQAETPFGSTTMKDHPMRFGSWLIAIAALLIVSNPALARHKVHHRHYQRVVSRSSAEIVCNHQGCNDRVAPSSRRVERYETASNDERVVGGRPAGCPHAFCGCGTSIHIFGRIIPELNLAANWRRFPPAAPAPGMVAWRYGHVFAIESIDANGNVVAYDPNSGGHRTRIHTVSLRGYHVVDPHGQRFASR